MGSRETVWGCSALLILLDPGLVCGVTGKAGGGPPLICTHHPSQSLAPILLISYDDNRGLFIGMSHKASVVKHLISSSPLLKCNLHSPAASPRFMQFPLSGMPPSHLITTYCSSSQAQVLTSARSPTIHPPPHVGRDISPL